MQLTFDFHIALWCNSLTKTELKIVNYLFAVSLSFFWNDFVGHVHACVLFDELSSTKRTGTSSSRSRRTTAGVYSNGCRTECMKSAKTHSSLHLHLIDFWSSLGLWLYSAFINDIDAWAVCNNYNGCLAAFTLKMIITNSLYSAIFCGIVS